MIPRFHGSMDLRARAGLAGHGEGMALGPGSAFLKLKLKKDLTPSRQQSHANVTYDLFRLT